MPGRSSETRERHERAVLRALEVGVEQAAADNNVTVARLREWMAKSQLAAPEVVPVPSRDAEPEPDDPIERLERRAKKARDLADLGERQADALLSVGKASEARNAAATARYSHSAAVELERAVRDEREHRVRLSEAHAKLLAEHVRRLLGPLGVSPGALAPLVRWWLGSLSEVYVDESGGVHSPECPPEVRESARAALRKTFEGEIRRELTAELDAKQADPESTDDALVQEWAGALAEGGEVVVGANFNRVEIPPEEPVGAEVVADAEVVPDPEPIYSDTVPGEFTAGYGDPKVARAMWERYKANRAAREERAAATESGLGVGRHESRVIA